ncbi:MAG: hypothetical protein QXS48_04395 [Candidatus Aenigmatarchaeota archaeon]
MPKKVLRCAICRSKDLNYLPWLGQVYECRNCGYRGPLFIEKKKKS